MNDEQPADTAPIINHGVSMVVDTSLSINQLDEGNRRTSTQIDMEDLKQSALTATVLTKPDERNMLDTSNSERLNNSDKLQQQISEGNNKIIEQSASFSVINESGQEISVTQVANANESYFDSIFQKSQEVQPNQQLPEESRDSDTFNNVIEQDQSVQLVASKDMDDLVAGRTTANFNGLVPKAAMSYSVFEPSTSKNDLVDLEQIDRKSMKKSLLIQDSQTIHRQSQARKNKKQTDQQPKNMLSLSNLSRINRLEEIKQQEDIKKIIEQQEFNVALLGGPSVGKTSLLRKISNNYVEDDGEVAESFVSISQEMTKHTIQTESKENVKVIFYDTKGHHIKSTVMQFYRDKQAFIVMCDLSDEHTVNSVPLWLQEIQDRANTQDPVIMVLANKCDLLDNIDQSIVCNLESELQQNFPGIIYQEISVIINIELQESMTLLADFLWQNRESYAQQRFEQFVNRNSRTSLGFVLLDPAQQKQMQKQQVQMAKQMRTESGVIVGNKKAVFKSLIYEEVGVDMAETTSDSERKRGRNKCCK